MMKSSRRRWPTLFIGHGSPMNLIEDNLFTQTYKRLGEEYPDPKAILCISAHWITDAPRLTANERPKQIFDFHGFPPELYKISYAPPGSPLLAQQMSQALPGVQSTLDWGLDHGAWALFHHMYPDAQIPILQLSLSARYNLEEHLALGQHLASWREQGVLVVGSGNLVHNLREILWSSKSPAHLWAENFEAEVIRLVSEPQMSAFDKIKAIFSLPDLKRAHPSLDHLIPLVYVLAAGGDRAQTRIEVRGVQNASVSMATLRFD